MVKLIPKVVTYSLTALLLQSDIASALTPATASFAVVVNFDQFSSKVTNDERDKIIFARNKIKTDGWCPYSGVFIIGRASEEEGSEDEQEALALRRAEQVKQLLDSVGFPTARTYLLSQRSLNPAKAKRGSLAELRFGGVPGHPQCSIAPDINGFRTEK